MVIHRAKVTSRCRLLAADVGTSASVGAGRPAEADAS
jgi:hypothetical protein